MSVGAAGRETGGKTGNPAGGVLGSAGLGPAGANPTEGGTAGATEPGDTSGAGTRPVAAGGASANGGHPGGSHDAGSDAVGGSGAGSDGGGTGGATLTCLTNISAYCIGVVPTVDGTETSAGGGQAEAGASSGPFQHPTAIAFNNSKLNGINEHGQIVGARTCGNETRRALLLDAGNAYDLLDDIDAEYSEAIDINDNGLIIGHLVPRLADVQRSASKQPLELLGFVRRARETTVLNELGNVRMVAVNNSDRVLIDQYGDSACPDCKLRSLIWQAGAITDAGESDLAAFELRRTGDAVNTVPGVSILSAFVRNDGSMAGEYSYEWSSFHELITERPFVFMSGQLVPLWGVAHHQSIHDGHVNDWNTQGLLVGDGQTWVVQGNPRAEPEPTIDTNSVLLWSTDCYMGCCSPDAEGSIALNVGGPIGADAN